MRTPVSDPVGLVGVYVSRVRVVWTVRVGGMCVSMVLGAIAYLAAGLCPTRLGVVDGCGSGCWLRCDTLAGCRELRMRQAAVPFVSVVTL